MKLNPDFNIKSEVDVSRDKITNSIIGSELSLNSFHFPALAITNLVFTGIVLLLLVSTYKRLVRLILEISCQVRSLKENHGRPAQ